MSPTKGQQQVRSLLCAFIASAVFSHGVEAADHGSPPAKAPTCTIAASTASPIVGQVLVLTAACSDSPVSYVWSGCTSRTSTCTVVGTIPGPAGYAVAATNAAGTGLAAGVSVIWQSQATMTTPDAAPGPCAQPAPVTLACSSGAGALMFEPIYSCSGNATQLQGWRLVQSTCASVPSSPARFPAWEFHNAQLDDYFITADPLERESLDRNIVWRETGVTYRVWGLGELGTSDMCRFYGDPRVDSVTGLRIGPDSHFYTAAPDECATVLVRWPQWLLEGRVFGVGLPQSGVCPTGTRPVTRYFRPFGAPSHRYLPGTGAQPAMTAAGWISEGVVWCAGE